MVTTFSKDFLTLRNIQSQEELFVKLINLYVARFPVESAYLLRYSPIGQIGEGIIAYNDSQFQFITHFVEDLRNVPIIMEALQERRTLYAKGVDYIRSMPSKFIFNIGSDEFIVMPIVYGNLALGYICGDKFKESFQVSKGLLEAFTQFGRLAGELFATQYQYAKESFLSKRELEVMQHIALGESTKEIAALFNISELTINQYVKSAIKKLQAKNRVEAVAKLCKLGVI